MNIKYDRVADAVYLQVTGGKVAQTLEMNDRLNVDLDASGRILGIEILDASNQKYLVDGLQKNAASGIPVEIILGTPMTI